VYNLNKGDIVDLSETYHISEERYAESPEIQLRNNDILLAKDGAGIGKIGIVQGLTTKATINSSLLLIRSGSVFLPKFLFYFLKGPKMQSLVRSRITGSATPHLFQRDIRQFDLLIPSLMEQEEIVREIDSRLSVIDEVEKITKQAMNQGKYLRQAILRAAFEGKLVPLDPNDEPAEKLLERIRAERLTNKSRNSQVELSKYVK
jgi:type I restriction enzyme S subunit